MPTGAMLTTVAAMWLIAVAIPGPNFLAVVRTAALRGRASALVVVAGLGIGSLAWSLAGLFGIHAMFTLAPVLYEALQVLGALYLVLLGLRIILASRAQAAAPAVGPSFRLGLLTSFSNPKSGLLVASLFAAVMPPNAPLSMGLLTVAEMVAISLAWYAALACLISAPAVAALFARWARWIDRLAGAVFIGFGARLIAERT